MPASTGQWTQQRDAMREFAEAAAARGDTTVDLVSQYSSGAIERAETWVQLLEEADEFYRSGHLLGTPASPDGAGAPTQLPTINVTAKRIAYKIDAVKSPKFTQPLLDTPQTINVIGKQIIQQQAATTLTEALRNSPGVGTFFVGENGSTSTGGMDSRPENRSGGGCFRTNAINASAPLSAPSNGTVAITRKVGSSSTQWRR